MNYIPPSGATSPILMGRVFDAPLSRVFNAWTEPDQIKLWFGYHPGAVQEAEIDLKVGGAWKFVLSRDLEQTSAFTGHYLEISRDERLVFTWSYLVEKADGTQEATPFSKVTVEFEASADNQTRINIKHEGIQSGEAQGNVGNGWAKCLENLPAMLAS
jgi:uncharacterized protein YndB with AHSA1/START domain